MVDAACTYLPMRAVISAEAVKIVIKISSDAFLADSNENTSRSGEVNDSIIHDSNPLVKVKLISC